MTRTGFTNVAAAQERYVQGRRERATRDLVVRRAVADVIDRAKHVLESQPGDNAALLEVTIALIGCVSPHFVGQSLNPFVGCEDKGEQQVDDGLLSPLDHAEAVFDVSHGTAPGMSTGADEPGLGA